MAALGILSRQQYTLPEKLTRTHTPGIITATIRFFTLPLKIFLDRSSLAHFLVLQLIFLLAY